MHKQTVVEPSSPRSFKRKDHLREHHTALVEEALQKIAVARLKTVSNYSCSKNIFALSAIFLTSCFSHSPSPPSIQSNGFIIVGEQAVKLVGHCSNVYSEGVNEYWLPSNEDIQSLEQALPTFLESFASQDISPQNYIRQYAGVIKNGHHIIFINGIHPGFAKSIAVGLDLSKQAFVVCGGGNMIFGLEYYVEGKTFTNFVFNPPR